MDSIPYFSGIARVNGLLCAICWRLITDIPVSIRYASQRNVWRCGWETTVRGFHCWKYQWKTFLGSYSITLLIDYPDHHRHTERLVLTPRGCRPRWIWSDGAREKSGLTNKARQHYHTFGTRACAILVCSLWTGAHMPVDGLPAGAPKSSSFSSAFSLRNPCSWSCVVSANFALHR